MKVYKLHKKQILPISKEEAWDFFSSPKNLREITPDELDFVITSDLPERMYPGMIVTYRVRPLFGIPVSWVTEITQVQEPNYFIDEQRFGPYKLWHHQHHFTETDEGLLCEDIVHYGLPFGIFGRMAHPIIVKGQLEKIFNYRFEFLEKKFGK